MNRKYNFWQGFKEEWENKGGFRYTKISVSVAGYPNREGDFEFM